MAKEFKTETQIQIQIHSLCLGRYHADAAADANTTRRVSERKLTSKV